MMHKILNYVRIHGVNLKTILKWKNILVAIRNLGHFRKS